MKPRKLTPAVAAAKQAMDAKHQELTEAKETVKRLEQELSNAVSAVRQAQEQADADLPQCRIVLIRWRSDKEPQEGARAVILRRTPGGLLVVRHVGNAEGHEYKFKWSPNLGEQGRYTQAERQRFWASDRTELRDVPPEFLPAAEEMTP